MARIRRHETIELDTGGWVELHDCEVLWPPNRLSLIRALPLICWAYQRNLVRSPGERLLLHTPKDSYVTKEPERPVFGPTRNAWRQVSKRDAYLWLQRHSRRRARRMFPELAKAQREHTLAGER
jgi:hypothetical protein